MARARHPRPGRRRASRPLAIVLVDDNPDIRETMFELLTTWGHNVETAADGPSGVELILRMQPDLAFVDIGLPGWTATAWPPRCASGWASSAPAWWP